MARPGNQNITIFVNPLASKLAAVRLRVDELTMFPPKSRRSSRRSSRPKYFFKAISIRPSLPLHRLAAKPDVFTDEVQYALAVLKYAIVESEAIDEVPKGK